MIKQLLNIFIQKLVSLISIRKIKNNIIKSNEFIKTKIFFNNILINKNINNTLITKIIKVKIYIIDNFAVNLLINNNIIYLQNIKLNSKKRCFTINKYKKFRVFLNVRNRLTLYVKRIICCR